MAKFQTLMLVSLAVVTTSAVVATGDEELGTCSNLRSQGAAPIPAYSTNMRVLMDSWNYQNLLPDRAGAVWEQVDNDVNNPPQETTNWIQQSNTPCQQNVQVCGFMAGPQDNWLITQLINRTVNGTRLPQINVMIEFEQRGCDVTLNCQQAFNTHIYELTPSMNSDKINITKYRQVGRVLPADASGSRMNETITINFTTNHSSFYFAIQDETTCMVITRLIIFYMVCPAQTTNLIHYPETVATSQSNFQREVLYISASCVENAQPENGVAPMISVCAAGGIWGSVVPGAECQCVPSYFRDDETCTPCPAGTYLSPSNGSCSDCPANSVSEEEGLAQCVCIEGYQRAEQGEEDLPCTLSERSSSLQQAATVTMVPLLYSLMAILAS